MRDKHLQDLLNNALEMYENEQLKNLELKKQYEIMKMNAEFLIKKNAELQKKISNLEAKINEGNKV